MNRLKYLIVIGVCVSTAFLTRVSAQDIMAAGGTITTQYEGNGANEAAGKVADGDYTTKYLTFNGAPLWIQWECTTAAVATQYYLIAANDAQGRDPRTWTLQGSNDENSWETLDTRSNVAFASRYMARPFFFENTTAYKYYRLNISALYAEGGTTFQLGEWRLLGPTPPEAAPTNLEAFSPAGNQVYLNWTDESYMETLFRIERSDDGGNTYNLLAKTSLNTTSYIDESCEINKEYFYRIKAVNPAGASDYSDEVAVTTLNYNGALVDLTDDGGTLTPASENTSNEEEVSAMLIDDDESTKFYIGSVGSGFWFQYASTTGGDMIVTMYTIVSGNDASDRDLKSWQFQGSNDGSNYTTLDTRTDETFADRGMARTFALTNPASYPYYRILVSALNGASSFQASEWYIWAVSPDAPAPPAALVATKQSKSEIALIWSDESDNETGFEVQRRKNGATEFSVVAQLSTDIEAYTDAGLDPATRYFYRVRALGATSASAYSNQANDSTDYDANLPLPPLSLQATVMSQTEVDLTWEDHSNNETGFKVQRSTDGIVYSTVGTVGEDVEAYNDENALLATHYYYRILAFNDAGNALLYSDVVEATTTGMNEAPVMDDLADVVTCNSNDIQDIAISGVAPGAESYQTVTLSVTPADATLFEEISITQPDEDGNAILSYKLAEGASGDTEITVTAKDNGGALNGGNDTYKVTFLLTAYVIDVYISSDGGLEIARGTILNLTADGEADTYVWDDGPGIIEGQTEATLTVRPTQGYEYTVTGATADGCTNTATVQILIEGSYALEPQNILTPNGDGKNDVWIVWNIHIFPGNQVKVFDQSGREVFSMTDYTNDWDGTYHGSKLADGVYYYVINLGSGIQGTSGALTIVNE